MPRRLLIIESQSLSSANEACFSDAAPNFIRERIDWDPSLPDRVRERRPDLLRRQCSQSYPTTPPTN